eukprot:9972595-Alexandrium_andersonii.AAC.1
MHLSKDARLCEVGNVDGQAQLAAQCPTVAWGAPPSEAWEYAREGLSLIAEHLLVGPCGP